MSTPNSGSEGRSYRRESCTATGKLAYASKTAAMKAMNYISRIKAGKAVRSTTKLMVFRCGACGAYHFGHVPGRRTG